MKILGAILAGGNARRFGSDKAEAIIDGKSMMAHVAARLAPQVHDIIICGRTWEGLTFVPDRPATGLGPLGGLAAALHYAASNGFDAVLSTGCDLPDLPLDLIEMLLPAPAVIKGQPLLGLWNSTLSGTIDEHLSTTDDLSIAAWIRKIGARQIEISRAVSNINTPGDLEAFMRKAGPRS